MLWLQWRNKGLPYDFVIISLYRLDVQMAVLCLKSIASWILKTDLQSASGLCVFFAIEVELKTTYLVLWKNINYGITDEPVVGVLALTWFIRYIWYNPVHGGVYSIQHYVIKFVSDLDFVWVLRFPPPIKLTTDVTEIFLKVALSTINQSSLNICI